MDLKDIKITSLSITGNANGSEVLYLAVAYGEGDDEVFFSKAIATKDVITFQHLFDAISDIAETAGVK